MIELLAALPFVLERQTPPPFGYHTGSTIRHEIVFELPEGWQLDQERLPRPGPQQEGIEILRIELDRPLLRRASVFRPSRLEIEYQIFLPVQETREVELPAWSLFFRDPSGKLQEYRFEPWHLTLSPLIPPSRSDHEVALRPPVEPEPLDLQGPRNHFLLSAALTLTLGLLLWLERQRRPKPLTEAAHRIPKLLQKGVLEEAFLELHRALDHFAGFVVSRHNLEKLLVCCPQLRALQEDLTAFFQDSEKLFFAGGQLGRGAEERLLDLVRRLSRLER